MNLPDSLSPSKGTQHAGPLCDRRIFLAGAGSAAAMLLLSRFRSPLSVTSGADESVLCAGSFGSADTGTLHTLGIQDGRCERLHSLPALRPAALAAHPSQPILYVANDVTSYEYRLRGAVEAFRVDVSTGSLERIARQPLALSATRPRSLAVSPNGSSLLVASFEGGAYNVLPIDSCGIPGAPSTILKQVGHGLHAAEQASAHPSHVCFHPHVALAVAADFGADRLDILLPEHEEPASQRLTVGRRFQCAPGSGPRELALHPSGRLLAVRHSFRSSLAILFLTPEGHLDPRGEVRPDSTPTAIAFHPDREVLYSTGTNSAHSSRLTAWQIDPGRGTLRSVAEIAVSSAAVHAMHSSCHTLWLASDRGVIAVKLDPATGEPGKAYRHAMIPGARSLAVFERDMRRPGLCTRG